MVVTGIARISGVLSPEPSWESFLFYTVLSNLLCLAWIGLLIVWTIRDLRINGALGTSTPFSLTDNLIHIITPGMLILDWLLFTTKGSFRWADPLRWALIPAAYSVFAFTYGGLGGEFYPGVHYPYPFMNVEKPGLPGVGIWLLGLSVSLIAVGYIYVSIDRILGRNFLTRWSKR